MKGTCKTLGHHQKIKSTNLGIKEREEIQTKGIDILFNKLLILIIIAEKFPNLKKGNNMHVQKV
jgi:hypothetical protein